MDMVNTTDGNSSVDRNPGRGAGVAYSGSGCVTATALDEGNGLHDQGAVLAAPASGLGTVDARQDARDVPDLTGSARCGKQEPEQVGKDPAPRAREKSNGSHPRSTGPVPSFPCNSPLFRCDLFEYPPHVDWRAIFGTEAYEEDPAIYGFSSSPSDFDTSNCQVVTRYIHRVEDPGV